MTYLSYELDETLSGEAMALKVMNKISVCLLVKVENGKMLIGKNTVEEKC